MHPVTSPAALQRRNATKNGMQTVPAPFLPRLLNPSLPPCQSVAHLNVAHTQLRNLAGLRGLDIVNGDLIIWDNPNMTSLQGLGPITQLYGKLWIDTNVALEDMTGLEVRVLPVGWPSCVSARGTVGHVCSVVGFKKFFSVCSCSELSFSQVHRAQCRRPPLRPALPM